MDRLSVGILNLDEAAMTIELLSQLARLSDEGWALELIVADNGSQRSDPEQLASWLSDHGQRFASVIFIDSYQNLGSAGGRNLILKLASEQRILILDNDVVLPESSGWLRRLWEEMDRDDSLGIIGTLLRFSSKPDYVQCAGIGLTTRGRVAYLSRGRLYSELAQDIETVVAHPAACWLMRRTVIDDIGYLPEEYHPMQYWDVDYCVRAGQAGWRIACDRGASILHHVNTTTGNLKTHDFARTAVKHGLLFRKKYAEILSDIADTEEGDVYWGPVPAAEELA